MNNWTDELLKALSIADLNARRTSVGAIVQEIQLASRMANEPTCVPFPLTEVKEINSALQAALELRLGELSSVFAVRRLVYEKLARKAEQSVRREYTAKFGKTIRLPNRTPFGSETRFIEQFLDSLAPGKDWSGPVLEIRLVREPQVEKRLNIRADEFGEALLLAAIEVVDNTGWPEGDAIGFVLSGEADGFQCAKAQFLRRRTSAASELILTVSPELTKDQVSALYAAARDRIASTRPPSGSRSAKSSKSRARQMDGESLRKIANEGFESSDGWGFSKAFGASDWLAAFGLVSSNDWRTRDRANRIADRPYVDLQVLDDPTRTWRDKFPKVVERLIRERLNDIEATYEDLVDLNLEYFLDDQIWDKLGMHELPFPDQVRELEAAIAVGDPEPWLNLTSKNLVSRALLEVLGEESFREIILCDWESSAPAFVTTYWRRCAYVMSSVIRPPST